MLMAVLSPLSLRNIAVDAPIAFVKILALPQESIGKVRAYLAECAVSVEFSMVACRS
jgi:hypothetical protein